MAVETIYSVDEAADILRIKPDALRRLTTGPAPKIGFLKTGRKLTFPESVIEAYIEAHKINAAPPNPFGLTDGAMRRVRRTA
jgi:hypothetical protein